MYMRMKGNKKMLLYLIVFLFAVPLLSGCVSAVRPGDMGLKWRPQTFGLSEKPLREGWYWHMPWNNVLTLSVQWQNFTEKVWVLSEDDLHIQVDTSVVIRPISRDIHKLILEIGRDYYNRIVKPELLTVVRSTVANYTMVEIPEKSPEIEARILEKLREGIQGKYIELDNVTINHIDFTDAMLKAIEEKLAKEQVNIQKDFEEKIAAKDAEIERIRAKGRADALQIMARGEAEAQKIRAEGQAEAQKVIDKTLTPMYLQFKAFDSPNTKYIYVPTGKDGLPIIISPEVE